MTYRAHATMLALLLISSTSCAREPVPGEEWEDIPGLQLYGIAAREPGRGCRFSTDPHSGSKVFDPSLPGPLVLPFRMHYRPVMPESDAYLVQLCTQSEWTLDREPEPLVVTSEPIQERTFFAGPPVPNEIPSGSSSAFLSVASQAALDELNAGLQGEETARVEIYLEATAEDGHVFRAIRRVSVVLCNGCPGARATRDVFGCIPDE